ncbi:MAG: hypothetical protein LBM73_00005, partial [Candidatus Nomurabacteria bacterium]|nr:hypothetical protein [Candidatus Nomurabacteria bacterium]
MEQIIHIKVNSAASGGGSGGITPPDVPGLPNTGGGFWQTLTQALTHNSIGLGNWRISPAQLIILALSLALLAGLVVLAARQVRRRGWTASLKSFVLILSIIPLAGLG